MGTNEEMEKLQAQIDDMEQQLKQQRKEIEELRELNRNFRSALETIAADVNHEVQKALR